jgi:hypothetical protein
VSDLEMTDNSVATQQIQKINQVRTFFAFWHDKLKKIKKPK